MYLKELRAHGFKSFADKTVIEFGKNINGIVGPNGSGKSNIVDAVRWVLGEQSIKSLRGDSTTDVIFSGSESRNKLSSASVSLVFDNQDKTLPIPFSEVAIKRIAFRTGENEYYINNERVRLKDIIELLSDSGTAKESFNIISQGKIDEILSNKPEERRKVFEEAAGVLKYKKRKEEALRKLDKTNQNLNRVSDIIAEINKNIIPLSDASIKANKYIKIKDELSTLEVSVIAKNIFNLNNLYKESKKKIEILENEISSISASNSNCDVYLLKEKEKLKEIRDNINKYQSELLNLTKEEEKITSDIKLFEERNKYKDEKDKISTNIISLKEEILNIKSTNTKLNSDLEVLDKKIMITSGNIKDLKDKQDKILTNKNNIVNISSKNNREIDSFKYKINYLEEVLNSNSLLPKGIKSILNNPKFSGIHNIISNLIEVDSDYSLAINTALSSSSSYLVVDNQNIAKELINYLKNNSLGRVTFYPLNVINERFVDSNTLNIINNIEGFIGIASDLVKYDSKYDNIIKNVLGNIIVADTIDNANIISNKINKKYKVVTLKGDVVNVGGSLTGGSSIKVNNSISVKYEIEEVLRKQNNLLSENDAYEKEIIILDKRLADISKEIVSNNNILFEYSSKKNILNDNIKNSILKLESKEKELNDLNNIKGENSKEDKLIDTLYEVREKIANINKNIELNKTYEEETLKNINESENLSKSNNTYLNKKERELSELNIFVNRTDVKLDSLLEDLNNDYNMTFEFALENYKLELDIDEASKRVIKLKQDLSLLGNVNLDAPAEYEELKERFDFLNKQKNDLLNAENTLYDIIKEMDDIMKDKFLSTFEVIKVEFKKVFKELFKGGKAELMLTDPDNILETGIEIKAEPPGKKLQSITLLSGGEKTFTAISLLFAILNVRPVPFCLFDEVEAALDDANVNAFGEYLEKYKDNTQFIIITHKKKTMEYADILYGITMEESGVSKIVSVKLNDIEK